MAHLTYFDTIEEYNAYINSEDYVKPNISYCADIDAVFMKEDFIPSIRVEYTISTAGETKLANTIKGVKAMKIDGELIGENVTAYTFTTSGTHTVEYQFRKQTILPNEFFSGTNYSPFTAITSVDLSNITYMGDKNFAYCPKIAFGDLELNCDLGNGCFGGISGLTSAVINGNIGNGCFGAASGLTSAVINGNIGNGNFGGISTLASAIINGDIGDTNFGGCNNLTDMYVDGNVGNNNFSGVETITSMTINGSSVGNGNYFYGFDTLHIKGNLGNSSYIYNVSHLIVDGDMGTYNSPGSGLKDITVSGNIGDNNLGGVSTLSAVTIGGDIGSSNFGGCSPINTMSIGGNVGNSNFSNGWHQFDSVEIGGNVGSSNNFQCNTGYTSNITISGSVTGGGGNFFSGDTLIIKGDCGSHTINYWHNVTIEGNFNGGGNGFTGVENVRIKGNTTNGGLGWGTYTGFNKESFIIEGSIIGGGCFNGITGPMIQVGGSIAGGCFQSINVTDVTSYIVNGSVGSSSFNNVSGLTDVTVNGDVGANSFGKTYTYTNSISSLTLTENCTSYGGYSGDTTCTLLSLTIQALTPPTLENTLPTTVAIYVPASAVDTYKAASGWSTYESQIEAIPNE